MLLFSANRGYVNCGLMGLTTNVNVVRCCNTTNFKGMKL